MKAVYLCGGINGLSDADCRDWRTEARGWLDGRFSILDPLAVDYRGREAGNERKIIGHDLRLLADADVLLVNAVRASWGTAIELLLSFQSRRPVVAFGAGPKPSPWLVVHTDHLCDSLAAACHLIHQTYGR